MTMHYIDQMAQDVRYSLRVLWQRPAFSIVAILTLALGIGANTAIFSVINAVVLKPLPYMAPEKLVSVGEFNPVQGIDRFEVSYPNFLEWQRQGRSFEGLAAARYENITLTGTTDPAQFLGAFVTANMFEVLGVLPARGIAFSVTDDRPGSVPTVILSHGFWQRRLGGDRRAIGQTVMLNGTGRIVRGIMPSDFQFIDTDVEVWLPLGPITDSPAMQNRQVHFLSVVGRLNADSDIASANAEMKTIASRIQQSYPGEDPEHGSVVRSLQQSLTEAQRPALWLLFGAVGLVLLLACTNVANLLLARASARSKELAIRSALGAGRNRTIRQLLTESILLALAGGTVSLLLALWSIDLFSTQLAGIIPPTSEINLETTVLVYTLAISLFTGAVFGLVPAIQGSKLSLNHVMKDRSNSSDDKQKARYILMVVEVAFSMVLLIGAGLAIRSFWETVREDPGFNAENLLTMTVSLPSADYPTTAEVVEFYRQMAPRLEAIPGVVSASAVNALPVSGGDSNGNLTIEGEQFAPGQSPTASYRRILPNYFRAMGIAMRRGREFGESDPGLGPQVVIVSESMAERHFPDRDPLGQRIKIGPPENEPWLTIVGVAGDVRNVGLDTSPRLATYEPHAQRPWRTMNLLVRTAVEPSTMINTVRRQLRVMAPGVIIDRARTMEQHVAASVVPRRQSMLLLGIFASMAVVLSVIGIYGVMSYTVSQRYHEIGVRMAIGAKRLDVFRLIVGKAMLLTLVGVILGGLAALALMQVAGSLLYNVSQTDPTTFAAITILLMIVAFLGSYLPARRATLVDPLTALRYE